jgi:uncharacterized protein involved in response to NO
VAITADLAFPTGLLAVAAREIITGRNWRNLPMTGPLALFIIADVLMHLEPLGFAVLTGLGWRLAVGAPVLLISVIGGRIIPSFTRNWRFSASLSQYPDRYRSGWCACGRAHIVGVSSQSSRDGRAPDRRRIAQCCAA